MREIFPQLDFALCPQVTRTELELKLATLKALRHMGSELKGHVNAASIAHLEEMLEKMEVAWQSLETNTETRREGTGIHTLRTSAWKKRGGGGGRIKKNNFSGILT